MSAAWSLPYSLSVNGIDYEIREDFRAILDILSAFADEELSDPEKTQANSLLAHYPASAGFDRSGRKSIMVYRLWCGA